MTRELLLVRHGETVWNTENRFQGREDSPLTERGREQARRHAALVAELAPAAVIASPLPRALATARILADALGVEPELEHGLAERAMGAFEGWSAEELREHAPEHWAARVEDPWSYRAPGGENYDDLLARLAPVVRRLRARAEPRLAVVSHGTLVRALLGRLLELPRETILAIRQPNDVLYRVELDARGARVMRYRGGEAGEGLLLAPAGS